MQPHCIRKWKTTFAESVEPFFGVFESGAFQIYSEAKAHLEHAYKSATLKGFNCHASHSYLQGIGEQTTGGGRLFEKSNAWILPMRPTGPGRMKQGSPRAHRFN